MPAVVSVGTAVAWLLLLLLYFVAAGPAGAIAFDDPYALVADAIVLLIIGVICGSVYFACRPRRWLAMMLLVVSLLAGALFGNALWSHVSFFHYFGGGYFDALRTFRVERIWLCLAVIFIGLALLWSVICMRLRDVAPKT